MDKAQIRQRRLEKSAAKAMKSLVYWQRRLNVASNKVRESLKKVLYYKDLEEEPAIYKPYVPTPSKGKVVRSILLSDE